MQTSDAWSSHEPATARENYNFVRGATVADNQSTSHVTAFSASLFLFPSIKRKTLTFQRLQKYIQTFNKRSTEQLCLHCGQTVIMPIGLLNSYKILFNEN